jgi:penicillin amidase
MTAEEQFVVEGLADEVEVLVDRWGVPHIYAGTRRDAFLAQGFNAARQRLFQIDLWRRRGLGRLAEALGPDYVEKDRAARLFLYRGDMHREWLAYGSSTKRIATAFTDGVNAYVRLCEARPELLPPEFVELGYGPAYWEPEDLARIRSNGLYHNLEQEVARARTMARFGPEVEALRRERAPESATVVPEGLDLSLIPADVLRVYRLATGPVTLDATPSAARGEAEGSNNWVVAGSRTASGRPLLANDPHRAVSLPSLRYIVHLAAPGLDVIGAGEPGLPGISVGHNQTLAFGFTVFAIDQEDLYVYRTDPRDPSRYRYGDDWEQMTTIRETIAVAGAEPVEVELQFTRHGPVICVEPEIGVAFAVRAAWLEPGMAPYLGSVDYMTAASAEDFVDAMNRWGSPGENHVYADVEGNIGWRPAGLVPIRPNWDGTLPVPGDGRYEWAGFYDMDQLPAAHNPEKGWFATANEMNLPADYPNAERTISYDFYPAFRSERISQVLAANEDLTVADCVALQSDYLSLVALQVARLVGHVSVTEPEARVALDLLTTWDGVLSPDSAVGPLFEVWFRRHLRPALLTWKLRRLGLADGDVTEALTMIIPAEDVGSDPRVDLRVLAELVARDPEALVGIMTTSLSAAVVETRKLFGVDHSQWRWGSQHRAELRHPLADRVDQPWIRVGPLPRGGSGDTVGAAAYTPDFAESVGATFRIVMDVGEWDRCVAMNSPGQSGDPRSPHYSDLFAEWAQDGSFPLLYSRTEIERHAMSRYLLVPPRG